MSNETKVGQILDKLAKGYQKLNAEQQAYAIKEINWVRLEISDMLAEFSDGDGIIKRQRLNRLLRELEAIERSVY
ncbi:hypothetical protein DEM28_25895, partial [Enterobacter mori]